MLKEKLRQFFLATCPEQELKRWFDPLSIRLLDEEKRVNVVFPHSFFSQWFASSNQDRFEEGLHRFLGNGFTVQYKHGPEAGPNGHGPAAPKATNIDFPFGPQFTFENFLVNKKNYFPVASAREVSKQREIVFNPFVICGQGGCGKTHLLKAVGNEISKKQASRQIFFGSVEDVESIYETRFANDPFKARDYLYSFDFLLVDDFQRIRRNGTLQQEMILIFNHFYDNKKQMVFSCADKLASYDFLDPTLKSRLEWGLIVNLKQPDLDIRLHFIQGQCKNKKIALSKEQILSLAQRFQDFRYLQGILIKIFAFKELLKRDIDERDFEHILNNTEDRGAGTLSTELILSITANYYKMRVDDLMGSSRKQNIALARQVSMFLCRQLLGASFPALGRVFGGKDHSTVLYSVRKIDELQKDDKDMKRVLQELKDLCLLPRGND